MTGCHHPPRRVIAGKWGKDFSSRRKSMCKDTEAQDSMQQCRDAEWFNRLKPRVGAEL